MAATMDHYVDNLHRVPVLILPCLVRYREPTPTEGASVYPACQNLLVAARAIGLGGVLTNWHGGVEPALRELLAIPDEAAIAATITLGHPAGCARAGPASPARRAGLRRPVGTCAGLGAGPARHPSHQRRTEEPDRRRPRRRIANRDSTISTIHDQDGDRMCRVPPSFAVGSGPDRQERDR